MRYPYEAGGEYGVVHRIEFPLLARPAAFRQKARLRRCFFLRSARLTLDSANPALY
jgi:hypothetical protein